MHNEQELKDRDLINIWFSVQILLTTLCYIGFLYFLRRRTHLEYTQWDLETTTISDYTMEYTIPEKIFTDFRDNIYPTQQSQYTRKTPSSGLMRQKSDRDDYEQEDVKYEQESLIYAFKLYLKNEFEGILKDTGYVQKNDNSLIEISHIHLGFDTVQLHYMLAERGEAIKKANHEKK